MVKEYDNTNSGVLFKNTNRKTEKSPEYTGEINADGQEYWLAAWVAERKSDGSKYFRFKLERKETNE